MPVLEPSVCTSTSADPPTPAVRPRSSITAATRDISPFVFPVATTVLVCLATALEYLHLSPAHVPYVTTKSSVLNVVFGKWCWLWTTVAYLHALPRHPDPTASLMRFALATCYWVVMAQWCWGPPLLDRIIHWTGACSNPAFAEKHTCLLHAATWHGHDISGHCFLLHHAYLVLRHEAPASRTVRAVCALWAAIAVITIFYYHHATELVNGIVLGTLFSAWMYRPSYESAAL